MSLYFQCHESWVTTGFHQLSCRWQNKYLKMFGASKAEGRENISWLRGRKLFFQKLLKCTYFFFFHLVGNQQGEDVSSYLLGLPAFLLLRRNSGEVYAPALEKKKKSLLNIKAITKKHKNTYFSYHNIIMITQEQVNVKMNHEVIFFPLGQSMMVHSDLFHSKFIYTMVGEI